MKGHIRERSHRNWATILDVPDPQTGKRQRKCTRSWERSERPKSNVPLS
jgi:hypothetical protein